MLEGSGCISTQGQRLRVKLVVKILTDWNDQSGESVSTNDTAIVHNVLGCNLPKDVKPSQNQVQSKTGRKERQRLR
jgi:hypothetical protein